MNIVKEFRADYDAYIIGAGPVGCVLAERLASELNLKVLIVEKRNHVAGNCFDTYHQSGVMIHRYGPHYFRTNSEEMVQYLSKFTGWIPGNYIVKSSVNGELYPFPINLLTLRKFFNDETLDADGVEALLESKRIKCENPTNSEEFVLSRVGKDMYETFYLGYTLKQWSIHPKDLAASVCGRIPVRLNTDERYVDHKFQLTPDKGFTAMFGNMVTHENIDILLEADFGSIRNSIPKGRLTIYTGQIDEYFGHSHGQLEWRSLEFEFKEYDQEYIQPCVQINYPKEHDYTRTVEIKHVTGQKHPHTVISYEYPRAEGDPYYPVPREKNDAIYKQYKSLAEQETLNNNVYFCGRLAEYKYFNTDEVIDRAMNTFYLIKSKYDN